MPLFGAHMSIAGGCDNTVREAVEHRCDALQLFTSDLWESVESIMPHL